MPARTRRRDLRVATAADARAEAQITGLREAAARALRLHAWQAAARPDRALLSAAPAESTAAPAKPRRGLRWPFARKPDPAAEASAAILAELEASVAGRPGAHEAARTLEAEPKPAVRPLRAVG